MSSTGKLAYKFRHSSCIIRINTFSHNQVLIHELIEAIFAPKIFLSLNRGTTHVNC